MGRESGEAGAKPLGCAEQPDRHRTGGSHFLYSPSSTYPNPVAFMVDSCGQVVHTWSSSEAQPDPGDDPPTFLRGWNHVEIGRDGQLFAIVPLGALLELDLSSRVVWRADVAAHHDLALADHGDIYCLTESPRSIRHRGRAHTILDNEITVLSRHGTVRHLISLYDVVLTDPLIAARIDAVLSERWLAFESSDWPRDSTVRRDDGEVADVKRLLATAEYDGPKRRALRLLRELPASPCDVLHTNTVELVVSHPGHRWRGDNVLIAMRNLDTIAVLDLAARRVLWRWGSGLVSGPHQPSVLPDGSVLVFDNGAGLGRSRLLIVDPRDDAITWEYVASPAESFYCPVAGGCELLPDGTIVVSQSTTGRAFIVTRDREIVWDWSVWMPGAGARSGRASFYRMAAVPPDVVNNIVGPVACP